MQSKHHFSISEFIINFFVTTGCICLLMGTLGLILFPGQRFGYEAFFMPLIFGFLTSLPTFLLRHTFKNGCPAPLLHFLNLLLIEGTVVGINLFAGTLPTVTATVLLIFGVALVYLVVNCVLWLNDRRIANEFNKQLSLWQDQVKDSLSHSPSAVK